MVKLRRYLLGLRYQAIAKEFISYDMIPEFLWTMEQKLRAIQLLEEEAEMDIQLAQYLIEDGDEIGIRQLNENSRYNANRLWNLKRNLA